MTSLDGDAVGGTATEAFSMLVGLTGEVVSLSDVAVDVDVEVAASIRNAGSIRGFAAGVILGAVDTGANLLLTNTGTIESLGSALILDAGSGSVRIVNTGHVITSNSPTSDGISAEGQTIVLQQLGDIVGNVRLEAVSGATLTNSGLIDGDVFLGASTSADTFRNIGGNVTGTVFGGNGFDQLNGGQGFDLLDGGQAGDTLDGGEGRDTLIGGAGRDVMTAGSGSLNDRFIFNALSDSAANAVDLIRDFDGSGDLIDLSAIDANGTTAGDGAFLFGGANFLAVGIASIRVVVQSGDTFIEVRDKDGSAVDMRIELTGLPTLTAADFVL